MNAHLASASPSVLGTWVATPVVWAVMVLGTVAYLAGTVRARPSGWPLLRVVWWAVAMVLLVFALNSSMTVFAEHLFWAHMVVHLTLITVVPLFLVLAQPVRLLAAATGERGSARMHRVLENPVMAVATSPIVGLPFYAAVLIGTHLTGFQDFALTHSWAQHLEYLLYLVSGWLFMMPLIGDELCGRRLSPPLRFASFLLAMGPDTLVGVVLMMTSYELAPGYSASRAGWGPTGLSDQSAAGAIMWFGGDGLMMLLLLVVAFQWIRAEGVGSNREHGASMGTWLDSARRGTLIGDSDPDTDIDDDEAALAAYNARLAELNRRER
ncbi:cytochrome c oxidase assembly protein [Tsukamurella sp. 8F]|uniref:cytochrome c oxidase assembly protein n=1 Tax=unclassified Tsukamurella TaxID=2633480 RepID=UPI0023B92C4E|nr:MULTISPECIES: cytochrome c oxidase assembly protein [unclassified Tsukamurella]MDF0528636.1 cytochrome c oxidase assembly protein [Tsukamurella sp. 8J]MDF0585598.1 cytochrome c oxidase assembly protein [Tsukamurella sp. 8F]